MRRRRRNDAVYFKNEQPIERSVRGRYATEGILIPDALINFLGVLPFFFR